MARRVSAIRDFPAGCGRFAPKITVEPTKDSAPDASYQNKDMAAEAVDAAWGGPVDSRVGDSTAILTQTSVVESNLKWLGQVADVVDGLSSVNAKQQTGMSLGALERTRIVEHRTASESELFERDGGVTVAPQNKDTNESSCANFCSGRASLTTGSTSKCLKKPKARSYTPKRRVLAIRDFSPHCGRNAPLRDKDACTNMATPLKEIKVSEETHLKDEEILRQTEVTPTNLIKESSRDQDSLESISLNEVTEATKAEVRAEREENDVGGKMVASKTGKSRKRKHADASGNQTSKDNASSSERENQDVVDTDEHHEDLPESLHPRAFTVNPPTSGHGPSESKCNDDVSRNKVRETLRLFQAICRKLLQEEEAKTKGESRRQRVDLRAAKILKRTRRFVSTTKQILGPVPGVKVGDEFQYRVELNIIGLHRQIQSGIDYVNQGGKVLAMSIVSSGAYCDDLDNSDFVIYTGSGGNVIGKDKEPEDQKLERGNLALSNSMSERNPVRVIRGLKGTRSSDSTDAKHRTSITYRYDGLYVVEECWKEVGQHGKLVFKFRLNRIPGQPELAWKVVSKKSEAQEGLCVRDISQGKESVPICVVNTIDNKKPPPFRYITRMIYPGWFRPVPPKGCDCSRGCSDTEKCICTVKNGGEIPYNCYGAIVEAKPLVYECGPQCKCPSSCHNRVTQRGLKFQLEIFKTELRGWGVRSLNSIPSGSFICEYVGELLDDKEAEERTGNDEYLFDIGANCNDSNLWGGLSTLMPNVRSDSGEVVEEVGFTIDAAKYGNVGRFINHSCSPNLYAQNVLYDHEDKRVPHIMFFAAENIPPLQELTCCYNYTIGQVRDSSGNIKKKDCYCGSPECTGRMY